MRRAWILLILAALLPMGAPGQVHHRRKKPPKTHKSVGQLRQEMRNLEAQKRAARAQLKKTRREAKVVLVDIHKVDGRLSHLTEQLADTEERLGDAANDQKSAALALADAKVRLADTKQRVERRLRTLYMKPEQNALTAVMGSASVGDVASREVLYSKIATRDHQIFDEYRALKAKVTEEKRRADDLVVRIAHLQGAQEQQQADLQDARSQKKEYLSELQHKAGELQELVDQFEEDERSIASQIQAYDASKGGGRKFTGRFSRPVDAPITSTFGMRYHPILHFTRLHAGVDFGASWGTTIHAAADGVVINATQMRGFGNVVIIDHGGGISTVYGHCSRFRVASGQRVVRGQPIAAVGSTGLATGPHLHFEVRVNGRPVNPMGWL